MKAKVIAIVQYGLVGYVLEDNVRFTANTIDGLIEKINAKTAKLAKQIEASQARHGDLRQYTPKFANGWPSIPDVELDFGEEFSGSLLKLSVGIYEDLAYNTKGHARVRKATGLD